MSNEIEQAIQEALDIAEAEKKASKRQAQLSRALYETAVEDAVETFINENYELVTTLIANGQKVIRLVDLPSDANADFKKRLSKRVTELARGRADLKEINGILTLRVFV